MRAVPEAREMLGHLDATLRMQTQHRPFVSRSGIFTPGISRPAAGFRRDMSGA